jgi:hypothetical protein
VGGEVSLGAVEPAASFPRTMHSDTRAAGSATGSASKAGPAAKPPSSVAMAPVTIEELSNLGL